MSIHRRFTKVGVTAIAGGLALAAVLSACGGGAKTAGSTTTTTAPGRFGGGGGAFPGAFGSVAAVSVAQSSMEVQNQETGQETVTWTSSTQFSRTATVSLSSIAAGDCITAVGSNASGTITASTVTVASLTGTSCTQSGVTGRRPTGGTGFPRSGSGSRGSLPSGGVGGGNGFAGRASGFGFASGKVTSVSSDAIVLTGFSSSGFARGSATSSTTVPQATTVHVDVTSTTAFSETETASASSLAVGDCVTASGTTDSAGAVAATVVRITSTGGQSCTTGFGGAFGGGGGQFGGGGGTSSAGATAYFVPDGPGGTASD